MEDEIINPEMGAGIGDALPSRDELLEAVEKMDMDEETKRKLIENIMSGIPEYTPIDKDEAALATSNVNFEMLMLLALISLVFTVLGEIFFRFFLNYLQIFFIFTNIWWNLL